MAIKYDKWNLISICYPPRVCIHHSLTNNCQAEKKRKEKLLISNTSTSNANPTSSLFGDLATNVLIAKMPTSFLSEMMSLDKTIEFNNQLQFCVHMHK